MSATRVFGAVSANSPLASSNPTNSTDIALLCLLLWASNLIVSPARHSEEQVTRAVCSMNLRSPSYEPVRRGSWRTGNGHQMRPRAESVFNRVDTGTNTGKVESFMPDISTTPRPSAQKASFLRISVFIMPCQCSLLTLIPLNPLALNHTLSDTFTGSFLPLSA